ncbi:MAG: hydroxyacylglutathione hydrolase [Deltaproteobacteria bacterium]|nr:MAG: hydroxyacylglutathione hydrolase [Deltaproteobacteria bacterium]
MSAVAHVVTRPHPPFAVAGGRLEVHQIPAARDNLVWLLVDPATGAAAAVDGPDAAGTVAYCEAHGLRLTAILNTHVHGDHVGINRELARQGRLAGLRVVGAASTAAAIPGLTEPVDEGDTVVFGGVAGRVMRTEGHVDGHLSYVFGDALFCGDTLFGAGCGYLFDGPPAKMHASLERLAALPGETRVCCAHEYTLDNLRFAWSVEPDNAALAARIVAARAVRAEGGATLPSTIALERDTNPFLRHGSATLRANVAAAWPGRPCETPEEIFTLTRALKDRKDYKALADADLPG